MGEDLINRLRANADKSHTANIYNLPASSMLDEWASSGVAFACSDQTYEKQYYKAVRELFSCVKPTAEFGPILQEGGVYFGCWLESTGTINAELAARFLPQVAQRTFESFAIGQRKDGLFPYKLTEQGPIFNQIQLVSPLARSVWRHYQLNGRDKAFLRTMYDAMAAYDLWIAKNRNTRNSGAVEAFCCFDTGHDLSARFWHIPDTPYQNDPAAYDPNNSLLPLIAPDLTANIACQRAYLAKIATELGEDPQSWQDKVDQSIKALFDRCYDEQDHFFYDLDKHDRPLKIQSDILLRVLACEIGDDGFFEQALERYLLNTSKFFARYPFTSVAQTDPRFDPVAMKNSWCGPTNFLSLIRAPHAFEAHDRFVELNLALFPVLNALYDMERFAQTLDPFTGAPGFTEIYSPTILALLDFTERVCGILPAPQNEIWFTGLTPKSTSHRQVERHTAYGRTINQTRFELVNEGNKSTIYIDGQVRYTFPCGLRLITDQDGNLTKIVGLQIAPVIGEIQMGQNTLQIKIGPNQIFEVKNNTLVETNPGGYIPINHAIN